jgi:hypothetical protein
MKKLILTLVFIATGFVASAQVGIGTTDPDGILDVVSTDSGVILPRVASTAAVTAPIDGMMIYDVSTSCIKAYEGGAWSACFSAGGGSSTSVRVTATANLTDADFNNVVVSGVSSIQYTLAGLNPSDGDTITIQDAVGDGTTSFNNATGAGLTGQATLLAPGGGLTIIYDAETDEWYTISAF